MDRNLTKIILYAFELVNDSRLTLTASYNTDGESIYFRFINPDNGKTNHVCFTTSMVNNVRDIDYIKDIIKDKFNEVKRGF